MKKTIRGPQGLKLILDSSEIFPDDPGNGTPAIVECKGFTATYWCACGTGELDCGGLQLTETQSEWLDSQNDIVDDFLKKNSPKV